jgi:SnoaL-like protein
VTLRPYGIQRDLSLVLCAVVVALAGPTTPASSPADAVATVGGLSLAVERAEDIRSVKKLQISYVQYLQFGLWSQASLLFADAARATYGAARLNGRDAIGRFFLAKWGNGREGLPSGALFTLLEDMPVLNLSADGRTAKGRWHEFWLTGQFGGSARWEQGISENEYIKERGVWKISRVNYYLETTGPYETGWVNAGPSVELLPFHYTSAEAGTPIPPIPPGTPLPALRGTPRAAFAALDRRIRSMNDEDQVANLHNAYGYYTDRKMWDDASDLFAEDGVLEAADVGIYSGARSIRRSYERFGPPGLQRGQLNDRLIFNLLVSVAADGQTARSRGVSFNLLGDFATGTASLGLDVLDTRFVKGLDGIWRIREMRVFPIMATDYYQGWARSRLVTPPVTGQFVPDKPVPAADRGTLTDGTIPIFFLNHPVTGKPVAVPAGARVSSGDPLLPVRSAGRPTALPSSDLDAGVADAGRRLARSVAYIAVDNMSHALGNYIDDQQWHSLGLLFAKDGWRAKAAVAFCVGPEHAEECERNYDGVAALPRVSASGHWLIQPVIDVAPDARSARMRHRLLHIDAAVESRGFSDGMYPNNAAKLEDGVWKFDVAAPDQPYFTSSGFRDGWARRSNTPAAPRVANRNAIEPLRNFPADVPRASMPRRHHGSLPGDMIVWPDIKPMWFSYRNPVSGRVPPLYCPDLKTCEKELETRTGLH